MFVCYLIKSVPYKESARDAPCQLRDLGARLLEGCRLPSFLADKKRDALCQFSSGRFAIFNIIDRPFHYRSLVYLIRCSEGESLPCQRLEDWFNCHIGADLSQELSGQVSDSVVADGWQSPL